MTIIEAPASGQPLSADPDPIAAFLGRCLSGPVNTPVVIESFAAFERWFGGRWSGSSLADQLYLFFQHGGLRAIVVRLANNATGGTLLLPTRGAPIEFCLQNPGSGERVRVSVDYDGVDDDQQFNLIVQRTDHTARRILDQEIHSGLSIDPASDNEFSQRLASSTLIRTVGSVPAVMDRPLATESPRVGGGIAYVGLDSFGRDGDELTDYDFVGSDKSRTGLFALDSVPHFDFLYACSAKGLAFSGAAFAYAAERYCAARNAMLIVDPPADCRDAEALLDWRRSGAPDSANILAYFPAVAHRHDADETRHSAAGAIMGLLCRQDREQHVFYTLADNVGQNSAALQRDWIAADPLSTDEALMLLNAGVNPILTGSQRRLLFPGLVTAANRRDRRSGVLAQQRLCQFILRQVEQGTRWAVFSAFDDALRSSVEQQVGQFMEALQQRGAFETDGYSKGWSVRCDGGVGARDQLRIFLAFRPVGAGSPFMYTVTQRSDGTSACRTAFEYDAG